MSEKELFGEAFVHYLHQFKQGNAAHFLTQVQLAKKLGVDRATISHWKKNRTRPGDRQLVLELAAALKLKRHELDHLLRLCAYPLSNSEEAHLYCSDGLVAQTELVRLGELAADLKARCPPFWVERQPLLEDMYQRLFAAPRERPGALQSLVIHGLGGSGKTVLVAGFLTKYEAQIVKIYREGVLWVDLEDRLRPPLLQIQDQLGGSFPTAAEAAVRQHILQQVRMKKLLWVIDGAETLEAANPWLDLIRAAQGKYILTLRETPDPGWLFQQGAGALRVGDFQPEEGWQLTEHLLQDDLLAREKPEWEEVARLVGHHPLSLRILAGCAYFDPTPARWQNLRQELTRQGTLALHLGSDQQTEDKSRSVHRCLEISYQRLAQQHPAVAECFRFFGILSSGEIQLELIQALCGENAAAPTSTPTVEPVSRRLAVLAQAGLVELNHSRHAYHTHSILHLFAQTLLKQNAAEFGWVGSRYLTALQEHLCALPETVIDQAGDPWLGEYLHALQVAYQLELIDALMFILLASYSSLLGTNQSQKLLETLEAIRPAFQHSSKLPFEPQALLHTVYGDCHFYQGESAKAFTHYGFVLEQTRNIVLVPKTLLKRTMCAWNLGQGEEVLLNLQLAERLYHLLPDELRAMLQPDYRRALWYVGWAPPGLPEAHSGALSDRMMAAEELMREQRFGEACRLLEQLAAELSSTPLSGARAEVLAQLAGSYLSMGALPPAQETLERLEQVLREEPETPALQALWAHLWAQRGNYEWQAGHISQAKAYYHQSLDLYMRIPGSEEAQHTTRVALRRLEEEPAQ